MPNTKEISKTISDFYKEVERDKAKKERALARKLKRKAVKLEAKANTKTIQNNGLDCNSIGRQRSNKRSPVKNKSISGTLQRGKQVNRNKQ